MGISQFFLAMHGLRCTVLTLAVLAALAAMPVSGLRSVDLVSIEVNDFASQMSLNILNLPEGTLTTSVAFADLPKPDELGGATFFVCGHTLVTAPITAANGTGVSSFLTLCSLDSHDNSTEPTFYTLVAWSLALPELDFVIDGIHPLPERRIRLFDFAGIGMTYSSLLDKAFLTRFTWHGYELYSVSSPLARDYTSRTGTTLQSWFIDYPDGYEYIVGGLGLDPDGESVWVHTPQLDSLSVIPVAYLVQINGTDGSVITPQVAISPGGDEQVFDTPGGGAYLAALDLDGSYNFYRIDVMPSWSGYPLIGKMPTNTQYFPGAGVAGTSFLWSFGHEGSLKGDPTTGVFVGLIPLPWQSFPFYDWTTSGPAVKYPIQPESAGAQALFSSWVSAFEDITLLPPVPHYPPIANGIETSTVFLILGSILGGFAVCGLLVLLLLRSRSSSSTSSYNVIN